MSDRHPVHDDLAAHALGALGADEARAVEEHLAGCDRCRDELDTLRAAVDSLAEAVPAAPVPAGLRARVLREAREGRSHERDDTPDSAPRPLRARSRWAVAVAIAASLVTVASLVLWRDESRRASEIASEMDRLRAQLGEARGEIARRDLLLETLSGDDIVAADLSETGVGPRVRIYWNRERSLVVLVASGLAAPDAGRDFQLWGIDQAAGTAPVSLGTFRTDAGGRGIVSFDVPPATTFDLAAITEEPAGGSPQPTSAPFLAGPLAGLDD